jgi:hypothetical protein
MRRPQQGMRMRGGWNAGGQKGRTPRTRRGPQALPILLRQPAYGISAAMPRRQSARRRSGVCCRSSVVEHSLGKGEVVCSIHTGSTRTTGQRPRQHSQPVARRAAYPRRRPRLALRGRRRGRSQTASQKSCREREPKRSGAEPRSSLTLSFTSWRSDAIACRAKLSLRDMGVRLASREGVAARRPLRCGGELTP